ncbi:hypothetical protein L4G92_05670 [Neisseria sp. ZJ106]|uniref:Uncharacterized protein n=1 Tax=Neisseria lisongii TaxID=2912188 RepID=A0ABY7RI72_9NEIS|nr:hypothetical protein [Neisseria lisongii]MCF7521534.1 hypothetical protein [Neisseria lisongii]WCL71037.1 hypothetical protein PJU73_06665 [Neisseria lisongii]
MPYSKPSRLAAKAAGQQGRLKTEGFAKTSKASFCEAKIGQSAFPQS